MNKILLGQPVEETFAGIENNQEETAQELTLEQLSRAVGENALLQTEVSRQMALKLVELRRRSASHERKSNDCKDRLNISLAAFAAPWK